MVRGPQGCAGVAQEPNWPWYMECGKVMWVGYLGSESLNVGWSAYGSTRGLVCAPHHCFVSTTVPWFACAHQRTIYRSLFSITQMWVLEIKPSSSSLVTSALNWRMTSLANILILKYLCMYLCVCVCICHGLCELVWGKEWETWGSQNTNSGHQA